MCWNRSYCLRQFIFDDTKHAKHFFSMICFCVKIALYKLTSILPRVQINFKFHEQSFAWLTFLAWINDIYRCEKIR